MLFIIYLILSFCIFPHLNTEMFDESSIKYQHSLSGGGVNLDIVVVAEAWGPFLLCNMN